MKRFRCIKFITIFCVVIYVAELIIIPICFNINGEVIVHMVFLLLAAIYMGILFWIIPKIQLDESNNTTENITVFERIFGNHLSNDSSPCSVEILEIGQKIENMCTKISKFIMLLEKIETQNNEFFAGRNDMQPTENDPPIFQMKCFEIKEVKEKFLTSCEKIKLESSKINSTLKHLKRMYEIALVRESGIPNLSYGRYELRLNYITMQYEQQLVNDYSAYSRDQSSARQAVSEAKSKIDKSEREAEDVLRRAESLYREVQTLYDQCEEALPKLENEISK